MNDLCISRPGLQRVQLRLTPPPRMAGGGEDGLVTSCEEACDPIPSWAPEYCHELCASSCERGELTIDLSVPCGIERAGVATCIAQDLYHQGIRRDRYRRRRSRRPRRRWARHHVRRSVRPHPGVGTHLVPRTVRRLV